MRKHDVSISFAEEDILVAEQIAQQLKKKCYKIYFYREESQLGQNLKIISRENYYFNSNHALVILSKNYTRKRWAQEEWRLIQKALRNDKIRQLFVVRLDHSHLKGFSDAQLYADWNENPKKITKLIHTQVKRNLGVAPCMAYFIKFLFMISALILIYFIYLSFR